MFYLHDFLLDIIFETHSRNSLEPFFRVGVEVVSAAMLCSQAHSLTRCLRNYFV